MKVSELDFLRLLPVFMRDDEAVIALSSAVDKLMGNMRLDTLSTWDKIDELNEKECDELAWELDIDWYDSASLSLTEKRETIKLANLIKRKRGTKWAVERVIQMYLGEGGVIEWFEKNPPGEPYTFEVYTSNETVTDEMFEQFEKAVAIAKNERSHMVGMSHRYLLNDIVTGQKYYLYVENGKLTMDESNATIEAEKMLFLDTADGSIRELYVSNGNLMMDKAELTYDALGSIVLGESVIGGAGASEALEFRPFKDAVNGKRYLLYASANKLFITEQS